MKMKVKSRFLGIGAKLALILLVAGSSILTSCYKENDDVTLPYVAPDPIYVVKGQVTDINGAGMSGVTVTLGTVTATTDATGNYTITSVNSATGVHQSGPTAGAQTIVFSKTGYISKSPSVTITAVANGSTGFTVVNAILSITALDANVTYASTAASVVKVKDYISTDYDQLDLINATNSAINVDVIFNNVTVGRRFVISIDAAIAAVTNSGLTADEIAALKLKMGEIVGTATGYYSGTETITLNIPPSTYLDKITLTGAIITTTYTIVYKGITYTVKVEEVNNYVFAPAYGSISHSHGHGHGHGGDLNAGGGIVDGIN